MAVPWTQRPDGLLVEVRLTPRAAMDRIDSVETLSDGAPVLKARVRAVPEKGKANDAVVRLLAKALGLPTSRARLLSGDTARRKCILLEGDGASLARALEALLAAKG
ncbi:MAG: hypothetical protein JWN07_2449 [Hyphomicrobiales bacterium]|nr:hypothetical protein [Hyphomicrobiales bacterium]